MINLNSLSVPMPALTSRSDETDASDSALSIRTLLGEDPDSDSSPSLVGQSMAGNELAAKNRIKQLKRQLEQLQQKLRMANARLAAIKNGRYRSEAARNAAALPARAEVMALNSALSSTSTALFMAEKILSGIVNITA
ncbi:hypothetical protein CCU68_24155 [Pseudomonas gingeri NCPPB 3146 = LMG 5327]|uniref:Uncharacterized protein n=2 Tax=Pseudomonas gingeri TaxID=117681 RepID=A0A7Y7XX80_9PSED|nr:MULTISPECIES: hypothetical protein [Pseudomonas]NVZ65936.1 hypothetical protein [Pseudomonas gingeri]NVZ75413.1 hypothetical protein [Pseudomonas gingeri]NWC13700.1 hypothetical protein [Pseudomonas gingeri]NWE68531.1 hypothetical protein [Pseudomonas gingeri]PNQ89987.1 hypothetical protein CCU68_24155 [Pseudomonas gingeri NCPPB 3146 = LMG 5327]